MCVENSNKALIFFLQDITLLFEIFLSKSVLSFSPSLLSLHSCPHSTYTTALLELYMKLPLFIMFSPLLAKCSALSTLWHCLLVWLVPPEPCVPPWSSACSPTTKNWQWTVYPSLLWAQARMLRLAAVRCLQNPRLHTSFQHPSCSLTESETLGSVVQDSIF